MKTEKMSFKNIKDVLSRDEMKMIMAGSSVTCTFTVDGTYNTSGSCADNNTSTCNLYCNNAGYTNCNCTPN